MFLQDILWIQAFRKLISWFSFKLPCLFNTRNCPLFSLLTRSTKWVTNCLKNLWISRRRAIWPGNGTMWSRKINCNVQSNVCFWKLYNGNSNNIWYGIIGSNTKWSKKLCRIDEGFCSEIDCQELFIFYVFVFLAKSFLFSLPPKPLNFVCNSR